MRIDALDTGKLGGTEPEAITLEAFGRDVPEDRRCQLHPRGPD